jgi:hypothetical protein
MPSTTRLVRLLSLCIVLYGANVVVGNESVSATSGGWCSYGGGDGGIYDGPYETNIYCQGGNWCWVSDCQCSGGGSGGYEDFYDSDCRGGSYTCLGGCG